MSLDLKQSLKLTQHLLMTPQLQQAIKLLQLSRLELEEFVANQIVENPVLEDMTSESAEIGERVEKETDADGENPASESPGESQEFEFEGYKSSTDHFFGERIASRSKGPASSDEGFNYENVLTKDVTLQEHLLTQVGELDFSASERNVASKIVGNLTEDGYLDLDIIQLANEEGLDSELIEGVLDTIQRLDPPGIAARTLSECLAIQLREAGLRNGIVERIVLEHLKELETRNYPAISKALGIDIKEVYVNVATIVGLNPTPGRIFGENRSQTIIPDVYVFKIANRWVVSLNEDNLPHLRVNDYYQSFNGSGFKSSDKSYITEKIKSANWLIRSIQQRQRTIRRVAECVVEKQYEFLEYGMRYLKPMVLRDVAEMVEMHESTISRVTSNKYMQTPRGTFELKFFFSSSIKADDEDVSSSFVKATIKEMIGAENQKKPYSDQKIVSLLQERGVHVARRTVAKYREQLGIQPSSKRRRLF